MSSIDDAGLPPAGAHPLSADPDPQGQAALLLVESLIHGLIGKSVLTVSEAVEIIDTAADIEQEITIDRGEPATIMAASLSALNAMSNSLRRDLDGASSPV